MAPASTPDAAPKTTRGATPGPLPRELYTIPETCRALHISHVTLYKYLDTGELPLVRIGRAVRIRHRDIEAFIDAHVTNGEKAPRQRRSRRKPAS